MLGYAIYKLRIKTIFLVLVTFSAIFYILQLIVIGCFTKNEDSHHIILWWTPFMADNERPITCANKSKCLLTKDRNYINNSDLQAVLYYGSMFKYRDLPMKNKKIWAIFHEESPRNVAVFLYQRTFDLFDITATFSRFSDFPLTLQYLENISIITDKHYVLNIKEKNKLLENIAPVLYIQSDCDTPVDRDAYINELMKYVKVDSFGKCLNNKKFPKELGHINPMDLYNDKLLHFIAKYKFVIAFENAICDDYITEKLWRPLMAGSIPIYLGSPSVQDWLPNKNSVILSQNFENPEELANYIKKVNTNDTLYSSFREHKNGKIDNEFFKNELQKGPFGIETNEDHPVSAFECFVCEQIHKRVKKKRARNVYDCSRPKKGNSWEYYWRTGDCESKALVEFVRNNVAFKEDLC